MGDGGWELGEALSVGGIPIYHLLATDHRPLVLPNSHPPSPIPPAYTGGMADGRAGAISGDPPVQQLDPLLFGPDPTPGIVSVAAG